MVLKSLGGISQQAGSTDRSRSGSSDNGPQPKRNKKSQLSTDSSESECVTDSGLAHQKNN